jgi:hypothetical protein
VEAVLFASYTLLTLEEVPPLAGEAAYGSAGHTWLGAGITCGIIGNQVIAEEAFMI